MATFYLSLAALAIAVVGGFYLLFEWFRHGRKHRLPILWALGFFSLYLFQIPTILANGGIKFVLTDFNPFFAIAMPLTVLGLYLILLGILSTIGDAAWNRRGRYLALWPIAAFAFFAFYFASEATITRYAPLLISIFLFYLPMEFAVVGALAAWYRKSGPPCTMMAKVGIVTMMVSVSLGIVRDFIAVPKILAYPPEFWFIAYTSFKTLFVLQALSLIILIAGFVLVHRSCCMSGTEK